LPQPEHAIPAEPEAFPLKVDMDAAIPKPRVHRRVVLHAFDHRGILGRHPGDVPEGGARHAEQRARAPDADPAVDHRRYQRPPSGRAHHFFAVISFMTSISRSRSASSFLSRLFSCCRLRSCLTSVASSWPNRLRHTYRVCSLTPCFLATSATGALSASRRILTICSSVNRDFRMGSSLVGAILSSLGWSENRRAGHPSILSRKGASGCLC